MKTSNAIALLCAVPLVMAGCATAPIYTERVQTVPAQTVTNLVPWIITETNLAGEVTVSTNAVPIIVEVPARTIKTVEPKPEVLAAIETVGTMPLPWAGTVALALGWLYTGIAAARNRKIAVALVQGIEAAREWLQTTPEGKQTDRQILDALKRHQEAAGVLESVGALVNRYTGNTVR